MSTRLFEDKTSMQEAEAEAPVRTMQNLEESRTWLKRKADMDVKSVTRSRRGHDI